MSRERLTCALANRRDPRVPIGFPSQPLKGLGINHRDRVQGAVAAQTMLARCDPLPPAAGESARALTANPQQLDAALRQIELLRAEVLGLRQQLDRLTRTAAQTRRFGYHDELTGLPNRRLLLERYRQAVALAARHHRQVVLVFLDLDGFKNINDTYGHATGDAILQQVAARLLACIRVSDTACRYGGDEFVVLLPEYEGQESAVAVVAKIRARLAAPHAAAGAAISVTVSIGMAVYPVDGHEYGDLMQATDRAMYRDKSRATAAAQPWQPDSDLR